MLKIKTPERLFYSVSIVDFEQVNVSWLDVNESPRRVPAAQNANSVTSF